jgi:hypothetical protein
MTFHARRIHWSPAQTIHFPGIMKLKYVMSDLPRKMVEALFYFGFIRKPAAGMVGRVA